LVDPSEYSGLAGHQHLVSLGDLLDPACPEVGSDAP
jgi:hypothetical protein